MKIKAIFAAFAALAIYIGLASSPPVQAAEPQKMTTEQVTDFYRGKTMRIYIPYGFGGTYGKYSRTMAQFLPKFIPGNPKIIVKSMSGAGGIKMHNYAQQAMPRDGYNLIMPADALILSQLLRPEKVRYNAAELTWIGSSNQTNTIFVLRKDSGITKWQDLKTKEVITGHTGQGSMTYLTPSLMKSMLGLKIKLIAGYEGSSKAILAMEQGEHQGTALNWLGWSSKRPEWFKKETEFALPIMQLGLGPDPDLPNVPMMRDVVADEYQPIIKFMASQGVIGRGLALPPGSPKRVVKPLRDAFDKMNVDPGYIAALKKMGLRILGTSGAEVQRAVEASFANADEASITKARKLIFNE